MRFVLPSSCCASAVSATDTQRIWLTAADVFCCCCLLLQLQDLLQRLSGAQQLVARVLDLETINSQQQTVITSLQQQLAASEQQVAQLSSQLSAWQARGSSAEQQLCEAQQQLLVSTPRPKRELGLLADLLTAGEAQLVEQALIAGEQHVYVAGRSRAWYARLVLGTQQEAAGPLQMHAGRSMGAGAAL